MFRIMGVDPGTTESGVCFIRDDYCCYMADKIVNDDLFILLKSLNKNGLIVAIESMQSYGMTMGASIIQSCYMIGRLIQICEDKGFEYNLVPRPTYSKAIICGNKVNDALLRAALENRFGSYDKGKAEKKLKDGTVKQAYTPDGPLVLLQGASDKRSAFGLAVYILDQIKQKEKVSNV